MERQKNEEMRHSTDAAIRKARFCTRCAPVRKAYVAFTDPARYNDGMSLTAIENSQVEIFARAIDGHADGLSPDVARFIVSLKLAEKDQRRLNDLAGKARQGQLTEAELEEFRRCGRLMEILKLKSRKVLQSA